MNIYKHSNVIVSFLTGLFLVVSCSPDDEKSIDGFQVSTADGYNNSHGYIDLGLPSGTLWAICNIGASQPEDYGLYFAWGESTGYDIGTHDFCQEGYKYIGDFGGYANGQGRSETYTKYIDSDKKTTLDATDDAATVNWGSGWQMPTSDQIDELVNSSNTIMEWGSINGVNGICIKSKANDKTIFLPAGGQGYGSSSLCVGQECMYWSNTLYTAYTTNQGSSTSLAYSIGTENKNLCKNTDFRRYGLNVRPICSSNSGTGGNSGDINTGGGGTSGGTCSVCDGSGKCQKCEGSGKCTVCGGNYKYKDAYGQITTCPYCEYGKCIPCKGTGNCQHCHGSGKEPQS